MLDLTGDSVIALETMMIRVHREEEIFVSLGDLAEEGVPAWKPEAAAESQREG